MKEILKNAIYMARRFKTASTLNLIGLVVAFATCYLLLTQIIYQYTYNRGVDDYQRLYRMESNFTYKEWRFSEHMCRPFVEGLKGLSQVESYSLAWNSNFSPEIRTAFKGKHELEYTFAGCNNTAVSALTNRVVDGEIGWTDDDQDGIIIPASIAQEYFGTTQAAGKQMITDNDSIHPEQRTVRGVYEDFPKNCELSNSIYYNIGAFDLTELYPGYKCYVKFTRGDHDFEAIIKQLKQAAIDSLIANSRRMGKEANPDAIEDIQSTDFKFIPLKDS